MSIPDMRWTFTHSHICWTYIEYLLMQDIYDNNNNLFECEMHLTRWHGCNIKPRNRRGNDLEMGFCFINKPNPIDFVIWNLKQQNMSTQCQVHIQAFPYFRITLLHLHHYLPIFFLREIKNPSPTIIPWISTLCKWIHSSF